MKINKKEILKRIISIPDKGRREFWTREYKLLNDLLKKYPNLDFWKKVKFNQDWDSLKILKSEYGKKILEKKYKEFNFIITEHKPIDLGAKVGQDKIINKKPKTIRDFLS